MPRKHAIDRLPLFPVVRKLFVMFGCAAPIAGHDLSSWHIDVRLLSPSYRRLFGGGRDRRYWQLAFDDCGGARFASDIRLDRGGARASAPGGSSQQLKYGLASGVGPGTWLEGRYSHRHAILHLAPNGRTRRDDADTPLFSATPLDACFHHCSFIGTLLAFLASRTNVLVTPGCGCL